MTPLEAALGYAARWPVFPWRSDGRAPLTEHGFKDASQDPATIRAWWSRSPQSLIGAPTAPASGFVLLDVDVKHPPVSGFDTLDELGFSMLPVTPIAHTPSGGVHLYFEAPDFEMRNTDGTRTRWSIGPGLDWRARGAGAKLPTPGSGYRWDPINNLATVPLAPVPRALLPRERESERRAPAKPAPRCEGLSPYAEAALDSACRKIKGAPAGQQLTTINAEAFSIGTLAGAGGIPEAFARNTLRWAGAQVRSHDARWPWRPREIEDIVDRAFTDGVGRPRVLANG